MFGFMRRQAEDAAGSATHELLAPADGTYLPIEQVADPAFSQKMLGDGFAVVPTSDVAVAPASGEVVMTLPAGHAYGLRTDDGLELLVHVGIDTVNENGNGFEPLARQGQRLEAGDALVRFDREGLVARGYDMSVIVALTARPSDEELGRPLSAGDATLAGKTVAMTC
jgi:sugar PTS system EIIA component